MALSLKEAIPILEYMTCRRTRRFLLTHDTGTLAIQVHEMAELQKHSACATTRHSSPDTECAHDQWYEALLKALPRKVTANAQTSCKEVALLCCRMPSPTQSMAELVGSMQRSECRVLEDTSSRMNSCPARVVLLSQLISRAARRLVPEDAASID